MTTNNRTINIYCDGRTEHAHSILSMCTTYRGLQVGYCDGRTEHAHSILSMCTTYRGLKVGCHKFATRIRAEFSIQNPHK